MASDPKISVEVKFAQDGLRIVSSREEARKRAADHLRAILVEIEEGRADGFVCALFRRENDGTATEVWFAGEHSFHEKIGFLQHCITKMIAG